MSEKLIQLRQELAENPYVTFDSDNNGVSRVFDDHWDFSALNQSKPNVNFRNIDKKHRQDIQSYLYALIQWQRHNSNGGTHVSVNTLRRYLTDLCAITIRWGSSDFTSLSNERQWKMFSQKLEGYGSEVTCRKLASMINTLNKANLLNRYVHKREYIKWVKENYRGGQALALPENIHASILKHVVEFVEAYHPYRHQISEVMAKAYAYQDEMLAEELKTLGFSKIGDFTEKQFSAFKNRLSRRTSMWIEVQAIPNFQVNRKGVWLGRLLKMSFACVALFSAARHKEILSMNKDSYEVTTSGISKISGITTKGKHGNKVYTTWNTAPIVKLALELASDATEATRKYAKKRVEDGFQANLLTKDQYEYRLDELNSAFIAVDIPYKNESLRVKKCFRYQVGSDKRSSSLNLNWFNIIATKEDVEEFDNLNPDWKGSLKLGGGLPRLSPHDLRRSFVVFMVKNRLGNALTVKYQLKHRNINMSNWYANYFELARTNQLLMDTQLMSEFDEAIENAAVDAWDEIYNVSDTLSGAEGERIAQNKAEWLAQGEEVVMSRSELLALTRSGDKSIVLLPTGGYCTNRNCERLCSMVDIVEPPCEHKVVTDKAAKRLLRERDNLITSFRAINDMGDYANELILNARKKKIQSIEPTLIKHNIPFESFNDAIKAVWS